MFHWKTSEKKTGLEQARDQALLELNNFTTEEPEYEKIIKHVKILSKLIAAEKHERLSPNTVAIIIGNAFIGLAVISYESRNVMTTKVLSFMQKIIK